jgi:TM2 domain-containing membrane protein YozV
VDYNIARKSNLDTRELLILDSEVKSQGKNMVVAYILWYFLGIVGGHRFYMKKTGTAVAQLIISITVIGMVVTFIWWVIDAFLLHTWVKEHNHTLENQMIDQLLYSKTHNQQAHF